MNLKRIAPNRTPKILLSGFNTFNDINFNPTEKLMDHFEQNPLKGGSLKTIVLNVAFRESRNALQKMILSYRPDIVLSFGLMSYQKNLIVEKRAINLSEGTDNNGEVRSKKVVVKDGPQFYSATVPIRSLYQTLLEKSFPVVLNDKASTFVCNHTFYATRHLIETKGLPIQSGFIHVPNVYLQDRKLKIYASANPDYQKLAMSMKSLILAAENLIQTLRLEFRH